MNRLQSCPLIHKRSINTNTHQASVQSFVQQLRTHVQCCATEDPRWARQTRRLIPRSVVDLERSSIRYPPLRTATAYVLVRIPPSSTLSTSTTPSRSALRFLFSSNRFLRSARIFICLFSTPVNQYPKLPPAAAKIGYAQSDSLLKKGRISIPSCQNRTARPGKLHKHR